jgi:hypothetical protein
MTHLLLQSLVFGLVTLSFDVGVGGLLLRLRMAVAGRKTAAERARETGAGGVWQPLLAGDGAGEEADESAVDAAERGGDGGGGGVTGGGQSAAAAGGFEEVFGEDLDVAAERAAVMAGRDCDPASCSVSGWAGLDVVGREHKNKLHRHSFPHDMHTHTPKYTLSCNTINATRSCCWTASARPTLAASESRGWSRLTASG